MAGETIDTFNKFLVGAQSNGIVIGAPPMIGAALDRNDALILAAWLVALADRDGKFQKVLAAVQNT